MPVLPFPYSDFHGGLNTKDQSFLLSDDQARDLANVQGTTAGAIVKRNGLVTFATPSTALTSLFALEATASPFLIGATGTTLVKITTGGVVSSIKTGLTSGLRWEFVQSQVTGGQGPLYGMNGTDTPQQWDGAALTTSDWVASTGTVPNGKYMVLAGNRIWVSGVAANPARVFFSDLIPDNNGPVTWPAANVSVFDENDGQAITGLGHIGPYVFVTKARKSYVINDLNTGDARRLSDSIGCISHRSIAEAPEGTYFLAEDRGVYVTNGSKVTPISDVIQPTVDSIATGQRKIAAATYFGGHYYLSVARSGSVNDTVLDYDSALQSWWLHTFGSSQFAVWHPTGTAELFSGKATGAIVDQCFVPGITVDNGSPFTWVWRGPWQSPSFARRRRFPTPWYRKNFRQIRINGAGSVDFSIGIDFSSGEQLLHSQIFQVGGGGNWADSLGVWGDGNGIWGDLPTIGLAKFFSLGVHNAISPVFSSTSTSADSVFAYTYMIADRRDGVTS